MNFFQKDGKILLDMLKLFDSEIKKMYESFSSSTSAYLFFI